METYGLRFKTREHTFSYIADTRYFEGLTQSYGGELIIINIVFNEPRPNIDHFSAADARRLISELKPKAAILTHFGMSMWRARPWKVAEQLSRETGVRVISARDGMKFDLAQLEG